MIEAEAVVEGLGGVPCDGEACPGRAFPTGRSLAYYVDLAWGPRFPAGTSDHLTFLWQCDVCGKGQWFKEAVDETAPFPA